MRVIHELVWQLTEATKLCPDNEFAMKAEIDAATEALEALAADVGFRLGEISLVRHRKVVAEILRRLGNLLRRPTYAAAKGHSSEKSAELKTERRADRDF